MNRINHVIFCIIDDVRSEHFFEYIEKGWLPNFKKLMENGTFSKNCITDFPSITYPSQVSQITGTYTGDYKNEPSHGIPVYNWMDRSYSPPLLRSYTSYDLVEGIHIYKMNGDLGSNCRTLLEMIGNENTSSITQYLNRGADYFFPENKAKLAFYYILLNLFYKNKYLISRANSIVVQKLIQNFKAPSKFFETKEAPVASLLWFMSSDLIMHAFGYDSNFYKSNLIHIDRLMGILLEKLDDLGYMDDTAIAVCSDHGNYKANRFGTINGFYEKNGLVPYNPRRLKKGNINISEFGSIGFFYFKSDDSNSEIRWIQPKMDELRNFGPEKVNMIEKLLEIDGCNLIYYGNDDNSYKKGIIHIQKKDLQSGKKLNAVIEYEGIGQEYRTRYISDDNENDPFNYSDDNIASKLLDNRFHSTQEWLESTYHLNYPQYPDLVPRHFKNPRSADLIVSTGGSVTYNIKHGIQKYERVFNHDIGLRCSSVVPLLIGGSPEIAHLEIACCKIVDIVPTLLKLIGKRPHKSVIGKSLL